MQLRLIQQHGRGNENPTRFRQVLCIGMALTHNSNPPRQRGVRMKNSRTRRSTSPSFSSPCRYSARPRIRRFMQQVRKAVRAMWATESSKPRPVRISVIFNVSSACHENRTMAFWIAKCGSSINIKLYQLIVSITGLSTLLAQILFSINSRRGTSSTARLWSLTLRRTGFEHV